SAPASIFVPIRTSVRASCPSGDNTPKQKTSSRRRRGFGGKLLRFPSLISRGAHPAGVGTGHPGTLRTGCRGIAGPVPPPLWIRWKRFQYVLISSVGLHMMTILRKLPRARDAVNPRDPPPRRIGEGVPYREFTDAIVPSRASKCRPVGRFYITLIP